MRYRPPMIGAERVSTRGLYPEGPSLVVRPGTRLCGAERLRMTWSDTAVSPAQPAKAAISPSKVSASAGDWSPKSR